MDSRISIARQGLLTLTFVLFFFPFVAQPSLAPPIDVSVPKDDAGALDFGSQGGFYKGDKVSVSIRVTSGGEIDVYVMTKSNFDKLALGQSFSTEISEERTKDTSFDWEIPSDATWYLVIDNVDNSRSNDATPTGPVSIEGNMGGPSILRMVGMVCGGLILLVVLILVVRYAMQGGFASILPSGKAMKAKNTGPTINNPSSALGFKPGSKGEALPTGSDIVEKPWFGEGGYFSQNPGFEGDDEGEGDEAEAGEEDEVEAVEATAVAVVDDSEEVTAAVAIETEESPDEPTPETSELPTLTIACPGCAHKFAVEKTGAAQKVTCPSCGISGMMDI